MDSPKIATSQNDDLKKLVEQCTDINKLKSLLLQQFGFAANQNMTPEPVASSNLRRKQEFSVSSSQIQNSMLETEYSVLLSRFNSLQNQMRDEKQTLDRQRALFEFQRKNIIDKALHQQQQTVSTLQQKLNDANVVMSAMMRKALEKDILIAKLQSENRLLKETILKPKKKGKIIKSDKKVDKRKNEPPRPLSGAIIPAKKQDDQVDVDSDEFSFRLDELETVFAEDAQVFQSSQPVVIDSFSLNIDETQFSLDEINQIIQKLIKIPYNLVCSAQQCETGFELSFESRLLRNHMYKLFRIGNYNVRANSTRYTIAHCQQFDDVVECLADELYVLMLQNDTNLGDIMVETDEQAGELIAKLLIEADVPFENLIINEKQLGDCTVLLKEPEADFDE